MRNHSLTFTYIFSLLTGLMILGLTVPASAQDGQIPRSFEPEDTGITLPQPMLGVDLYKTPSSAEIVVTSVEGDIKIFTFVEGKYEERISTTLVSGLTTPVVGDFIKDDQLEIAVGTQGGRLVIFNPLDLSILAEKDITGGSPISRAPTVVPIRNPQNANEIWDVIVTADDSAQIHASYLDEKGEIQPYWNSVNAGGTITSPLSFGSPINPSRIHIVAPLSTGEVLFIDAISGRNEKKNSVERNPIESSILLTDLQGDSRDELIYILRNGGILRIDAFTDSSGRLQSLFAYQANDAPVGDPVLVSDGSGPTASKLIFWPTISRLFAIRPIDQNPSNWYHLEGNASNYSGIKTPLALIPQTKADSVPRIAYGQDKGISVMDPNLWFQSRQNEAQILKYVSDEEMTGSPITISKQGDGGFDGVVAAISTTGVLHGAAIAEDPPVTTFTPWMTRGGSPHRKNYYDVEYFQKDSQRRQRLDNLLAQKTTEMNQAVENSDWETALAAAKWRQEFDPFNPQYDDEYQEIVVQKNFLNIILVSVTAVVIVGFLGFVLIRSFLFNRLRKQAQQAVEAQDYDTAASLYEKLHSKRPKNQAIIATLATVYITQANYSEKTIPVYEQAIAAETDESKKKNVTHALANAYAEAERTDEQSRTVYVKALESDFPAPALLHFQLARSYSQAGDSSTAINEYQSSISTEKTMAALSELSDIYISQNNTSREALEIYEEVYSEKKNNPRYLEAFLTASLRAGKKPNEVESLCYEVLDRNPDFVVASLTLAEGYLDKGESGRAVDEAKRALEADPDNIHALTLLTKCYLAENKKDDDAKNTFLKFLKHEPNNNEVLQALVEIFYYAGEFAGDAVQVYHKSYEQNPEHPTTLKALARVAKLSSDHELSIKVVEPLIKTGYAENEHTVQLANAYVTLKKVESRTEKVLRDALRVDRDNEKITSALARYLASDNRDDAESLVIYENHLENDPDDIEVSTQLVRAFARAARQQDALELALQLKEKHPNDSMVENIVAFAQLQGNKLDEAVSEYESILERDPSNEDAQLHLAEAYAYKMRTDSDAAQLYERALRMQPNNSTILLAMARVDIERNDTVKAIQNYQKFLKVEPNQEDRLITEVTEALEKQPDAIRIRWFLCEVLVGYGRLREAMEQLNTVYKAAPSQGKNILNAVEKVLAKDKKNITALATKGRIMADLGKAEEAMDLLEDAIKLQPNNQDVAGALISVYEKSLKKRESSETRFRMGRLYFILENYDEAIAQFQRTAQDYRTEADSGKMLGRCFVEKNMYDQAFAEFQKLVVDEEVKELMYDLAKKYESAGDINGAKNVYRQIFAADIGYKDVKARFEALSNPDSSMSMMGEGDNYERTSVMQGMNEQAKRRYELLDELGRGAMGIVYKAKDKELDEVVALKILPDQLSENQEAVRRFKIEARNARKLSHPNIVRIHDIGEEAGKKYISMEFVDGSDLKKKVKTEGRFKLDEFFKYSSDIASALGYAHTLGIVHRDIKPANIMLDVSDMVKVTDFGIAKLLDSASDGEGTMVGAVIGTPLYMSPEQVQGVPVDNRADLYAFGVMMYEFLNTKPPFTKGDLAYQHIHEQPPRIEDVPDEIWNIIAKCLEKDKDNRYANAEEIVDALREAKKQLGV